MRKPWLILAALCAMVVAMAVESCTNATCYDNRASVPLAGFRDSEGKKISLDSLEVYAVTGTSTDSVIAATPGARISNVYLPLRPDQDVTQWVIAYRYRELNYPELNDTITLGYTSQPYFASDECGVVMRYCITSLGFTTHLIDEVELTDSVVSNIDVERMLIYFRTSIASPDQP